MTLTPHEIDALLLPIAPSLAKEADTILDLRDLLMSKGHPGKCVRCFFRLFTAAGTESQPKLAPLRNFMEQHLEIAVRADGAELEVLPVTLLAGEDLEEFCLRSMKQVRLDRTYRAKRLELAFRYKAAA
ncbi:hypothetical protein OKA04_19455 [Luteolibacter flavescens]|uniref:Uncharacterized protein n=1 Tax=Luteolibacter flavescens TaxID=1859460 RepID=A0ABT3FUM7_9BACT|nr:hypothetical protein [Luteolibacter flavescens]MCW1886926.1 hypothetical protein [Luteolibacter flavescens]